jgi:pantoate--beta-alanine ligase
VSNASAIVLTTKTEVREAVHKIRQKGLKVGFIPTMGYLHKGHLSLVDRAKLENDVVIVSIFINPTQFSPNEDLARYPRDIQNDINELNKLNTDYIFIPTEREMYAENHLTWVNVDKLGDRLCGASRPGHFRGVTTVVLKLLNIVSPNSMYMGEKDFQQLVILEQMIADLDIDINIVRCPTVREYDGLAMSSRNSYLSKESRKCALSLSASLKIAQKCFNEGTTDTAQVISKMKDELTSHVDKIDYIEIIDSTTLEPIKQLKKGCRVLLAAFINGTRLIDNTEIN